MKEKTIMKTKEMIEVMQDYETKSNYRPYNNADEFLQAQREHGMYLRQSADDKYMIPVTISGDTITLAFTFDSGNIYPCRYSYDGILEDFAWQDGTTCGVED